MAATLARHWGQKRVMKNQQIIGDSFAAVSFGRITSILFSAGGWLIAGIRAVLDIVGYSTIAEDAKAAQGLLANFLEWVLSVLWWIPWGFALLSTVWLTWVSWPRNVKMVSVDNSLTGEHLIDPWVADGQRTFAKVKLDIDNWRAETVERENIYEVKVSFIGEGHESIEMVVVFDRWVPASGLVINCDRKKEGYRTELTSRSDRYVICRLYNINLPCTVMLDFDV